MGSKSFRSRASSDFQLEKGSTSLQTTTSSGFQVRKGPTTLQTSTSSGFQVSKASTTLQTTTSSEFQVSNGSISPKSITSRDFQLHKSEPLSSRLNITTTISPYKDTAVNYTQDNINTFTKFLIKNGDICTEKRIDFIVYIQSHWTNVDRRRSIRETWLGGKLPADIIIKSVFILGKPINKTDQVKINNENLVHEDIVQGDFLDTFYNLTLKSILALRWIYQNCRKAKFVLKVDDDIFVDMLKVVHGLVPSLTNKTRNIVCSVKEENTSIIVRDKESKWYLPEHIFHQRTHLPRFCTGYFVLMTSDLVPELAHMSEGAQYIPVDDVYLFGLLPQTLPNITYTDISRNMTLDDSFALDAFSKGKHFDLIAVGASKDDYMEMIWRELLVETLLNVNKFGEAWSSKRKLPLCQYIRLSSER
ncbi:hypothetical protein CHS0354_030695 [Potamilus streckersoni]|uniref:Hexosyltransferase n=1 Tax=Potamilus streckersoni TaxID=2493646 RepID=A0AAE0VRJ7_9BIVA|nr:hypothetical protein CHS0354_030695 [Potamilus streckersoni]